MIECSFLLCVDDLSQTVSPHAALCLATGLEHALLPCLQSPHPQTHLELLSGHTQQLGSPLQEVYDTGGRLQYDYVSVINTSIDS